MAYSLYCCVRIIGHTIHDRSPLSSLLCQSVFAVMNGVMSNEDIEDFCQHLPKEMWFCWGARRYIILFDEHFSTVLMRIKRRGDGSRICQKPCRHGFLESKQPLLLHMTTIQRSSTLTVNELQLYVDNIANKFEDNMNSYPATLGL